jgi:hypothetical protein
MKELIGNPEKLRKLLLPVAKDDYIFLMREIARLRPNGIADLWRLACVRNCEWRASPPTVRNLLKEAYERKYSLLNEEQAKHLCELAAGYLYYWVAFPYIKSGKIRICKPTVEQTGGICDIAVDLDKIDGQLENVTYFFMSGWHDRSDGFKC